MRHLWSVLCQNSTIDSDSNQISLLNCLEQLKVALPPEAASSPKKAVPIQFELVSLWMKPEPGSKVALKQRIEIVDPEGNIISSNDQRYDIEETHKRFRTRTKFPSLLLTTEGNYVFRVYSMDFDTPELVAELPLEVTITYTMKFN